MKLEFRVLKLVVSSGETICFKARNESYMQEV